MQKLKDKFENVGRKLTIINSDRVDLTKNQIEIIELKNSLNKIKNLMEAFNTRLATDEKKKQQQQ